MQTLIGKAWDKIPDSLQDGPRMASRISLGAVQFKEFCALCVYRSAHEIDQSRPYWQWPQLLREKAGSYACRSHYTREYAKQLYHWKKLVHEMRQL